MGYFLVGLALFFIRDIGWIAAVIVWTIGIGQFVIRTYKEMSGKQWEHAYKNSLELSGSRDTLSDETARRFADAMSHNTYHENYYIPTKEEKDVIAKKYGCNPSKVNYDYENMANIFYHKHYLPSVGVHGEPVKQSRPVDWLVAKQEGMPVEIVSKILDLSDEIARENYEREAQLWKR